MLTSYIKDGKHLNVDVFRVENFEALDNISSRLEKSIMVIEGVVPTTCSPPTPEPPITASQGTSCSFSATELSNRTSQAAADIVFLLDGSGSVAADQFLVMKTFVKKVTRSLLEFNTSFAFAQYSSGTTIHVTFHQFQRTGWENQVDSISQMREGTYTAGAIQTVVNTLFDSSAGARPDAHRILIVLTDGQSSDASSYPSVTAQADRKNITRYAIGIGSAFNSQSAQDELRSIASSPESDYVFRVDNFEALDNISSRLEKSIMAIEVPGARVICTEKFMAFELERTAAIGLFADHLRLNDPNCTLYSNGTHMLANMSLTACGTVMEDDGEYLIFKNEVMSFDDLNAIITRSHEVEIEFSCKYPRKSGVTIEFGVYRPAHSFRQKGFGSFTYQFEFFQSAQFLQMMDPKTYPLDLNLGDMMFWQIEAISSVPNTELFVESCIAEETCTLSVLQLFCRPNPL